MLIFTEDYTVPPFHHIVFCLNIYNTLVTLTTNTPRLYEVVVKYNIILIVLLVPHIVDFYVFCIHLRCKNLILHYIACPSHCICSVSIIKLDIGRLYEVVVKYNIILIVLLVPLAVEFYFFCIYLRSNNRILHCISCPSHCMYYVSIINLYIGK